MNLYVDIEDIDNELSLLPELYSPEQMEIINLIRHDRKELCALSELARVILPSKQEYENLTNEPHVLAFYSEGRLHLSLFEPIPGEDASSYRINEMAYVIIPKGHISAKYVVSILGTELVQRQLLRSARISFPRPLSPEDLSAILVPKHKGRFEKEILSNLLTTTAITEKNRHVEVLHPDFPLSDFEALANAVMITENEISDSMAYERPAKFMFVQHLGSGLTKDNSNDETPLTATLIDVIRAKYSYTSLAARFDMFSEVLSVLKEGNGLAWLNMSSRIADLTGIPTVFAKKASLRSLLLKMSNKDTNNVGLETMEMEMFNRLLEKAGEIRFLFDELDSFRDFKSLGENLMDLMKNRARLLSPSGRAFHFRSVPPMESRDLIDEFLLTRQIRDRLEVVVPTSIGYPSEIGKRPLLITGSRGSGKTHLLRFLATIAEDKEALAESSSLSSVTSLQQIAGNYDVIYINGYELVECHSQRDIIQTIEHLSRNRNSVHLENNYKSQSDLCAYLIHRINEINGKGLIIVIDELEALFSMHASYHKWISVMLEDLLKLVSRSSVRLLVSFSNIKQPFNVQIIPPALQQGANILSLQDFNLQSFSEYIECAFSLHLLIQLPIPPEGPGGVLLRKWDLSMPSVSFRADHFEELLSMTALARRYEVLLRKNLLKEMALLQEAEQRIGSEIARRIRHMFKNRIGGMQVDLEELSAGTVNSAYARMSVIDQECADHLINKYNRREDYYQVTGYLGRFKDGLDTLVHIVDRIKQYYYAGSLDTELVDVNEEISVKLRAWERKRQDVRIIEDYDPLPGLILIAREEFREVLDNILDNSDRHLDFGCGHQLSVSTKIIREKIVIEISNTGPKDLPPNPKDSHVTTDSSRGTGFGLAIVDKQIRKAGGSFEIFAREDEQGVTNRIELPYEPWNRGGNGFDSKSQMPDSGR